MTRHGKLIDNIMTYSKSVENIGGAWVANPTEEQLRTANFLPVVDEPPHTDSDHYAIATGWDKVDDEWHRVYEILEVPPPPPRIISKFNLEEKLFSEGLLDAVDQFIDSQTITNEAGQTMPLRRKYNTAQEFSTYHPDFDRVFKALKSLLQVSDEKAEEILEASIKR